jgi:tetratricopeptide (TPR) repeat protein
MAAAVNPKDAEAYNNRGLVYAKQHQLTQAVSDYTKAIELNHFYEKAYKNREQAYYKLKQYNKAWSDVFTLEIIGGKIDPNMFNDLKEASSASQ